MYINIKHCFHSCHQCDNIDELNKYKQQTMNNLQFYSCARSQHAHAIRMNWLNIITTYKKEKVAYDLSKGRSAPGGTFRGAAKLRLYLKIWEGEIFLRFENFRKGLEKSRRSAKSRVASKKKVVKNFWSIGKNFKGRQIE